MPGETPPDGISKQSVQTSVGKMEVDNRNVGPQNEKRKRHADSYEKQTEETN